MVRKRQKRPSGVDEMVISLSAKGLTSCEVQARLAAVHGAEASRHTVSPHRRQAPREDPRRRSGEPADLRDPARHGGGATGGGTAKTPWGG
ncbi:hypothetical protein ABZS53_31955 [Streptomyces sp. NPDC005499]|uniref:hypothetical protein n=1 Tax=Streptomyces sp. NPDC005499 TaxID=3154883 RepID=UPI0033B1C16E